jgi:hypothetical protein
MLRAALTGGYRPIRTLVKKRPEAVPFGDSSKVLRYQHINAI